MNMNRESSEFEIDVGSDRSILLQFAHLFVTRTIPISVILIFQVLVALILFDGPSEFTLKDLSNLISDFSIGGLTLVLFATGVWAHYKRFGRLYFEAGSLSLGFPQQKIFNKKKFKVGSIKKAALFPSGDGIFLIEGKFFTKQLYLSADVTANFYKNKLINTLLPPLTSLSTGGTVIFFLMTLAKIVFPACLFMLAIFLFIKFSPSSSQLNSVGFMALLKLFCVFFLSYTFVPIPFLMFLFLGKRPRNAVAKS